MTSGFTLVEMIVTMAILAILLSVAAPSYNSTVSSTRMSGEINNLMSSLNLARSEAIKQGLSVSVCPAVSPTATTNTCAATSDWSTGWIVASPALSPTSPRPIQVSPGVTHGDTLTYAPGAYPMFLPSGYTSFGAAPGAGTTPPTPTANNSISLHDSSNNSGLTRCIVFCAGSYTTVRSSSCP